MNRRGDGKAETAAAAPAVELSNVQFSYNSLAVLQDVSLAIERYQNVCIVGPNGGGKTTLLKLVLGLLQPTAGSVSVFGGKPERARRRVGYVPQVVNYDLQFPVTAGEVVLMGRLGRRWGGPYSGDDKRAAAEAMEQSDIAEFADRPFTELSGGQLQRVLIARALCSEPELLLLDEPTANVDARAGARLMGLLERLADRKTILMVSHDLGLVSGLFDKVVCVNRRVVVHPTAEVTGKLIRDVFGADVRVVLHDYCAVGREGEDG